MLTVGFDLDKVVCLARFTWMQLVLDFFSENFFWWLQEFRFLQWFYNYFFRVANPEIRVIMKKLKERGIRIVIISATNEAYRKKLEKWLMKNDFCFDDLVLKDSFEEDCKDYKKRLVSISCDFYFDDKEEIVRAINDDHNSKCRAILYHGQTSKELLKRFFPIFV